MKVVFTDLNDEYKMGLAIKEAVSFLKEGKIIIYPTDTIYGLGCDALNEKAVEKIFQIKERNDSNPFSVIVKDIEAIKKIAFVDENRENIARKLLSGPFTLIFPGAKNVPKIVTGGKDSIGIKIPNHLITQKISDKFKNPVITTSVNISGEEPLSDPFKIVDYFKERDFRPDLILDSGKIKNAKPSVVIDITKENPQIVRSGMLNLEEIKKLLQKLQDTKY